MFTALFNGRDLTGWSGDPKVWSVKEGMINGTLISRTSADDPNCLVWRGGAVQDFEVRLSYRLIQGNSGVYYRARELGDGAVGGLQFDIMSRSVGNLIETGRDRPRRDLARDGKRTIVREVNGKDQIRTLETLDYRKEIAPLLNKSGWNELTIRAQGGHIVHEINGHWVNETTDENPARLRSGVLALELTAGPGQIQFRNIRFARLPVAPVSGKF